MLFLRLRLNYYDFWRFHWDRPGMKAGAGRGGTRVVATNFPVRTGNIFCCGEHKEKSRFNPWPWGRGRKYRCPRWTAERSISRGSLCNVTTTQTTFWCSCGQGCKIQQHKHSFSTHVPWKMDWSKVNPTAFTWSPLLTKAGRWNGQLKTIRTLITRCLFLKTLWNSTFWATGQVINVQKKWVCNSCSFLGQGISSQNGLPSGRAS